MAAREKLDKYRAPLLAAVDSLGTCLNNIRCQSFLAYLDDDNRRTAARNIVLFRLAQYFGWTEIVYDYADRLRFERNEATKEVKTMIREVGSILARDRYDRTNEDDSRTSQLMLWWDEQRAIRELMRQDGDEPRCLSFDSFVTNYDKDFEKWFATLARDLEGEYVKDSERLGLLQLELARLVRALDVYKILLVVRPDGENTGENQPRTVWPWWQPTLADGGPPAHSRRSSGQVPGRSWGHSAGKPQPRCGGVHPRRRAQRGEGSRQQRVAVPGAPAHAADGPLAQSLPLSARVGGPAASACWCTLLAWSSRRLSGGGGWCATMT